MPNRHSHLYRVALLCLIKVSIHFKTFSFSEMTSQGMALTLVWCHGQLSILTPALAAPLFHFSKLLHNKTELLQIETAQPQMETVLLQIKTELLEIEMVTDSSITNSDHAMDWDSFYFILLNLTRRRRFSDIGILKPSSLAIKIEEVKKKIIEKSCHKKKE